MVLQLSPQVYTWLCGAFASLGSVLLGYDLGIIASVIPAPDFFVTMGIPDEKQIGLIVSLMLLGAFTSNLVVGYLADTYGRRPSILVGCVIFMLGGALQTGAKGLHWMYAGRFIAGLGIGMLAMLAPLYQSEIAHPAKRGRVTSLQQFMIGIGAFMATCVGYGCFKNLTGQSQWRTPLGLQLVPSVPLALFILLLPESPRYLASKGRNTEALHTLARLHANGDIHDPFVKGEYAEIIEAIEAEQAEGAGSYFELLTTPTLLRRVVLGCSLQFGLQMTGIAALEYYSPTIFAAMGFDTTTTLALQAGSAALALVAEVLCIAYIDRLGRRTPLITTVALCGFSFLLISILQAKYGQGPRSAQIGFVAVTWFYTFMFSFGIGPLAWAIPVEMFGSKWRGKATAVTSAAQWISNFMIAQITPIALKHIGTKYWIVFAVCGFTDALFYWAFLPETRGVPLEEVDAYFAKVPLFVPTSNVPVPTLSAGEEGLRAKGAALERESESVEDEKVSEV